MMAKSLSLVGIKKKDACEFINANLGHATHRHLHYCSHRKEARTKKGGIPVSLQSGISYALAKSSLGERNRS